jgi:radical SAM superfamily enzyme YgiQ (UPF0313 family)
MQVCLLAAPTLDELDDGPLVRSQLAKAIAEHAPVGILSLAAVLEERGIAPVVLNLNQLHFQHSWPDRYHYRLIDFCALALRELSELRFDVIGLSSMCSTYPLTVRIAREVKRLRPGIPIILGGPQASVVDVATLEAFPFVDLIVRGEAEETLPLVLDALDGRGELASVPGITFRHHGGVVRNSNAPVIQDLDSLPLPAFHLVPGMAQCRYIPLELGRGCPFACTFCSTNDFFRRRFRLKSPALMIEQMSFLHETYGINRFDLVHDMFTVDRRKVADFCEAMLMCGKEFRWSCSARTDCVDEDLIRLMYGAGCRGIFFGLETGSTRMQKIIEKDLDVAEAARAVEWTTSHGIKTTVATITGFPEEERGDLEATISFLMDSVRSDYAVPQLNILAPLAETPILENWRSQLILDDVFSDMSRQGWNQDAADRDLIERHPNIFPNFYGLPTPLGRKYLGELVDFFANCLERFRWLIVALHQESGSLLKVFDAWLAWRQPDVNTARYYGTVKFTQDFRQFLREIYLEEMCRDSVAVAGLLQYQDAICAVPSQAPAEKASQKKGFRSIRPDLVPRLAPGVRAIRLRVDVRGIIDCLRARKKPGTPKQAARTLITRPASPGKADLLEIPPVSAHILDACDGRRSVREIVKEFSSSHSAVNEMPPEQICIYGIKLLCEDGLIHFMPA